MTKLIVAFRNFAKAPNKKIIKFLFEVYWKTLSYFRNVPWNGNVSNGSWIKNDGGRDDRGQNWGAIVVFFWSVWEILKKIYDPEPSEDEAEINT